MMVSMPFQLFHFNFIMGRDMDEEFDEPEAATSEDDVEEDAWMFWSPSAFPSKQNELNADSYWKQRGSNLHEASQKYYIDAEEDSFMFFNPSATPSKDMYLSAKYIEEIEEIKEGEELKIAPEDFSVRN